MKWGVRRTPEQLGHKTGKKKWRIKIKSLSEMREESYQKKKAKLDAKDQELQRKEELKRQRDNLRKRQEALKADDGKPKGKTTDSNAKRNAKDLSDDELRQILSRYNMEQQYAKISKEQSEKGKSWVNKMLRDVGQELAKDYTKKMLKAIIDSGIEKAKKKNNNNSGGNSGSGSS